MSFGETAMRAACSGSAKSRGDVIQSTPLLSEDFCASKRCRKRCSLFYQTEKSGSLFLGNKRRSCDSLRHVSIVSKSQAQWGAIAGHVLSSTVWMFRAAQGACAAP